MSEKGKLIGIGVGPGDTELLTLKAAKVLDTVPVYSHQNLPKKKTGKCAFYFHYLKKGDMKKLSFIQNIKAYEDSIEDLKLDIENRTPEERSVIENIVNYGISNMISHFKPENLEELIDKEFTDYIQLEHLIPTEKHITTIKELLEEYPSVKYIKAHPYINTPALKKSIENLPDTVEDVFVDFDDTIVHNRINFMDEALESDLNEVNSLSELSTDQIYDFYPHDEDADVTSISGGGKDRTDGLYVPAILYFHRKNGKFFNKHSNT